MHVHYTYIIIKQYNESYNYYDYNYITSESVLIFYIQTQSYFILSVTQSHLSSMSLAQSLYKAAKVQLMNAVEKLTSIISVYGVNYRFSKVGVFLQNMEQAPRWVSLWAAFLSV